MQPSENKWLLSTAVHSDGIPYGDPGRSRTVETIMARISGHPEGHAGDFQVKFIRIVRAPLEPPGPMDG